MPFSWRVTREYQPHTEASWAGRSSQMHTATLHVSRSTVATCESSSPHRTTTVVVVGIVFFFSFFSVVVSLFVCLLRVDLTRVHSQTSTGNIFYFVSLFVCLLRIDLTRVHSPNLHRQHLLLCDADCALLCHESESVSNASADKSTTRSVLQARSMPVFSRMRTGISVARATASSYTPISTAHGWPREVSVMARPGCV